MLDFRTLLAEHLGTICVVVLIVLAGVACWFRRPTGQRLHRNRRDTLFSTQEEDVRTAELALALTNGKGVRTCGTSRECSSGSRWSL